MDTTTTNNDNTMDGPTETSTSATVKTASSSKHKRQVLQQKLNETKEKLAVERLAKRKLYESLMKVANQLKSTQEQLHILEENVMIQSQDLNISHDPMMNIQQRIPTPASPHRTSREGGLMWRRPELLPALQEPTSEQNSTGMQSSAHNNIVPCNGKQLLKAPVSLSDLFFDLVIVTAFTRVGVAIQDRGTIDAPALAYFVIFWLIWGKEASFSTRFDTSDLSSQVETLLTCFAVLFGSLSSTAPFESGDGTRMMMVPLFVAVLHFFLHFRVYQWFKGSMYFAVTDYAFMIMIMTALESCTWIVGIFVLPENSAYRKWVFLVGILFGFRVPRTFLPNDFQAACSKRGVLFILLLGFIVQTSILTASPFFDYQMPQWSQYLYLGLACFLMFFIKLLYVDNFSSMKPEDHALLVNRFAGFFFHIGQLMLLLSTTVLGAGLNLLTHSYMAATTALPANAKLLVCSGFSGVILSIGFIKSMHQRRLPVNPKHKCLFFAAYGIQTVVLLGIVYTTASIAFNLNGFIGNLYLDEIQMLGVLSGLSIFLLIISWLDQAVEMNIYGNGDADEFRVHPFGLWNCCFTSGEPDPLSVVEEMSEDNPYKNHLSPLLAESQANLFDSFRYNTMMNTGDMDEEDYEQGLYQFPPQRT